MSDEESIELDSEESSDTEVSIDPDAGGDTDVVVSTDSASSMAFKDQERRKIQAEIEAFLASGGKINTVDSNVVADPPKKPSSSYGSQPI
jgi:hypothetical protein